MPLVSQRGEAISLNVEYWFATRDGVVAEQMPILKTKCILVEDMSSEHILYFFTLKR